MTTTGTISEMSSGPDSPQPDAEIKLSKTPPTQECEDKGETEDKTTSFTTLQEKSTGNFLPSTKSTEIHKYSTSTEIMYTNMLMRRKRTKDTINKEASSVSITR